MDSSLKSFAERALIVSGVERIGRQRHRHRTLVLAYHDILPDGDHTTGDSSLHLPRREFAHQLELLARSHDVVPIVSMFSASQPTQRPRVVITFDDAYSGALSAGVEELTKHGMPATIFVAPGLLGCVPWWDTLADQSGGAVPEDFRNHALETLRGEAKAILSWAHSQPFTSDSASALPRIATESQLQEVASNPGITLASHSWSHANLSTLTNSEIETELLRPLEWLRSRFASVVPWLSYPYGLFSESVQDAAARAGYVGAFRIDGGWMPRSPKPSYALPRLNVPAGLSIDGFRLRLAGL